MIENIGGETYIKYEELLTSLKSLQNAYQVLLETAPNRDTQIYCLAILDLVSMLHTGFNLLLEQKMGL